MVVKVPSTATRHMISRFSYGYSPALRKAVAHAGGARAWFDAQLQPSRIPDQAADAMKDWFPYLKSSSRNRQAAGRNGRRNEWELSMDLVRWTILRRMLSNRQLFETMVDFWSNLLHVPAYNDGWMFRASYDATIRRYALGKFSDLLVAATLHPAMMVFLDSARSTKKAVNENHGRELLELHTVGVNAGYTEAMVLSSARILTGYHVETWLPAKRTYHPDRHWTGRVSVLGFTSANADPDGRSLMRRYLHYLATHPATANRLAKRLCQRFVSDTPSDGIVRAVAHAYTKSGTDIRAALRALVDHPDFAKSVDAKVRTPAQDAIATYRALGVKVTRPTQGSDFGYAVNYVVGEMGEAPFMWPAPNGFPELGGAWASAGRMRNSWEMHYGAGAGWWPRTGMSRKAPRNFLPAGKVRLDAAVDHVSRQLLGRKATAASIKAAAQLVQMQTTTIIERESFGDWRAIPLISAVLNSPEHLRK
jgi:uncharacterized protein (DUF1800 family)